MKFGNLVIINKEHYIRLVNGGLIKLSKDMMEYLEISPKKDKIIWNERKQKFEPIKPPKEK